MHQLLSLKFKISVVVTLAAVVSAVASVLVRNPLAIGVVVAIVHFVVVQLLMRSWPWIAGWPLLPAWTSIDISGDWVGTLSSERLSGDAPTKSEPKQARLTVNQNWAHLAFDILTDEMVSTSFGVAPTFEPGKKALIFDYFFRTAPTARSVMENPPQTFGRAQAVVNLLKPDEIRIRYINERGPGGEMTFRR